MNRRTDRKSGALRLTLRLANRLLVGWLMLGTTAAAEVELLPFVPPDLEHLEGAVASQLRKNQELLEKILDQPNARAEALANAFGQSGRLYHAYELHDPAVVCYTNAASLAPGDLRWPYLRAVLDHQEGRIDDAIQGYEAVLEVAPRNLAARIRLGEAYLSARRADDARSAFEQVVKLEPGSAAALAGLGQVALSEKQYQEAVGHLEAVLASTPEANRLHHPLGLAYRGLGDMDKAREHLMQRGQVGVKPADPLVDELPSLKTGERVLLLRGHVAFRAGRFVEAAEAYRAALAAAPKSVRARVNLGSALAQTGDRDAAIQSYREALELAPDNRTALYNLGVLLTQAGDMEGAARMLEDAVAHMPEDVEARLELARALGRLGQDEKALTQVSRAVELDPAGEESRLFEGQILVRLGRFAEARQRLEAAHELMPEAGRIVAALAKLLAACPDLSLRDGPRAVELAMSVYQATGSAGHAETLAMALAESGRCEEAVELQRKVVAAAQTAGAEALVGSLSQTLALLERQPCRMPGA